MPVVVRTARSADHPGLPAIERAADGLFEPLGITFPPGPTVVEEAILDGSRILVAGDPPVAFAALSALDGLTHLEQIAVHPDHVRRGIGTRLLREAVDEAPSDVSLITFRDVPWNGPWYARHGFVEMPEERWGPGLRELWQAEIAAGLHALAPRLVMVHRRGSAS